MAVKTRLAFLAAVLTLAGCASSEPPPAETVTISSQSGASQACLDALDLADETQTASGALLSSVQDALDAAEAAIKALGDRDQTAFDDAFEENEAAKSEIATRDRALLDSEAEYREAARACRQG